MKHVIDKSFSFAYGHRVWSQRLDTRFTDRGDSCLACRHLHGHEGLVKLFLEEVVPGTNIAESGMVLDFKMLGFFKNFIDDVLDHKMILDVNDPILVHEVPELISNNSLDKSRCIAHAEGYWTPDLSMFAEGMSQAIFEKYEGMIFVDFVPTSENLAAWLLSIASNKLVDIPSIRVSAIEFNETPKSHCRVEA